MRLLKWLFGLGDLDAYYVPKIKHDEVLQEVEQLKAENVSFQNSMLRTNSNANEHIRALSSLLDTAKKQLQDEQLLNARLWNVLQYNEAPGTLYIRIPGTVCSSINQEALTMLHRRFEIHKDSM